MLYFLPQSSYHDSADYSVKTALLCQQTNRYTIDMCNGPIFKKMMLFAVPLVLSGILQLFFNAADIIVVGKFAGDNSLAAVGSTSSLIHLLVSIFLGLSVGANVLAGRHWGAQQDDAVSKAVHTAMSLSLCSGFFLTIIGVFGARQVLIWMQTPGEVLELAVLYLRIYFLGTTANMIYNYGAALLRAVGDTKRPFYYLLIAGIVNVVLNLILVIVFNLGVAGVGLATVISQVIAALLVLRCLMQERGSIQLVLRKLQFDRESFRQILWIGLPAGFQGVIFAVSNVVIQSSVNTFGETVIAGNSAAANLEGFIYLSMVAFYQTTISFSSQNFGAKNYKRINSTFLLAEVCVIVIGLCMGNAMWLGSRKLLGIYSSSPEVIAAGMIRMKYICRPYFLCGMMDVATGALRGIGYSVTPMLVALFGACGLRLLWLATVFQQEKYHTIATVYLSYPISWIVTLAVLLICFGLAQRKNLRSTNHPTGALR